MIEVYDNKRAHEAIAEVASHKAEFKAAAAKIFAEIEASAAAHTRTGELAASFSMHQGKVDFTIAPSTDYDYAIEFGHHYYKDAAGKWTTPANAVSSQKVPGQYIMRKVVEAHGGF